MFDLEDTKKRIESYIKKKGEATRTELTNTLKIHHYKTISALKELMDEKRIVLEQKADPKKCREWVYKIK